MENSLENINLRFGGIARLYGVSGLKSLLESSVMVIGLGGVGSWAVEALVRSAVGTIILVDLDDVCITNTNRQLCATNDSIGKSKAEVLKNRVKSINPEVNVIIIENFFTASSVEEIFSFKVDYIIDAIDSMENKCILINEACKRNIPIITTGGAAGKIDPTQIKVDDIAFTTNDVFLQIMRKRLRRDFGFKKAVGHSLKSRRHMGVMCVYSPEDARYPTPEGEICHTPNPESNLQLDCESGMGSATMVTGSFGFIAASFVVKEIAAIKNI